MKLKIGDIIEVHGFVMLEGLNPGRYRVKDIGEYKGIPYYAFTLPKGKKVIVKHKVSSVDYSLSNQNNPDLNKMFKLTPDV